MNEIEEAIEYFIKDMESFQCLIDNKLFSIELAEIYRNRNKAAIQVLEKQISKKPLEFNVLQNHFGKLLYKRGKCPICGKRMINDINYCSNCGQAIDWSGEE